MAQARIASTASQGASSLAIAALKGTPATQKIVASKAGKLLLAAGPGLKGLLGGEIRTFRDLHPGHLASPKNLKYGSPPLLTQHTRLHWSISLLPSAWFLYHSWPMTPSL